MTNKKSFIQLPETETNGLMFEVSTELNCPDAPLVFLKVSSADGIHSSSFSIGWKEFDFLSECLNANSRDIEEAYEKFWDRAEA